MRIGIVTPRYPPTYAGGGEISAQLLAEQLDGHDEVDGVEVFSFDGDRTETVGGVPVRRVADVPQYPYTLPNEIAYRKLRGLDLKCDVLHAYNMHLHPAVGRLSASRDVPAVATLNAYPLLDWGAIGVNPSVQRRLYELTLLRLERPRLVRQMRNVDAFLPLSRAVERVYRDHGFDGCEFRVIPNMLDPSFAVPDRNGDASDRDGAEGDPGDRDAMDGDTSDRDGTEGDADEPARARLLYVGYLRDSKGVRYLVDAMDELPPTYALEIVGDGPKRDDLEARAARGTANERISFTGEVPYEEVTRAYARADVFVHPGVWPEPFGRTILEAMQAGLPVIATDVGGPGETVRQPELRCSPRDPSGLGDAIERAYENRDRIGPENETYVRETYHPREVVPRFLESYRSVLDGR